jgi:CRISPR-associated protein Csb3
LATERLEIVFEDDWFTLRSGGGDLVDPREAIDCVARGRIDLAPGAEKGDKVAPIVLAADEFSAPMKIDWWKNRSLRAFKMWSGQQSSLGTSRLLHAALAKMPAGASPLDYAVPLTGRFGFDPAAGRTAMDIGFSPDRIGVPVFTFPAVELLAVVGLQFWQFEHVGEGCWEYVIGGRRRRFGMNWRGNFKALTWAEEVQYDGSV